MPQSESFSSLSDIMKRIQQGSSGLLRRQSNPEAAERTQSMMDLSIQSKEAIPKEKGVLVPRFKTNVSETDRLMKDRKKISSLLFTL